MTTVKLIIIFASTLLLLAIAGALAFTYNSRSHKAEITKLQNEIATRDHTIELQKNVYSKLVVETTGLQNALDVTAEENQKLLEELKARKAELLTSQRIAINWKKAYEAEVAGHQTEVTTPEGIVRKQVDFKKDFGYIIAEGHTLTDPPEAFIRVKQGRPLKLTMVVSQEKDKSWRAYTTSSEENMAVDIEVSSVNPHILDPKWYEKIGFHADIAASSGVLIGLGASYKIGKFTVGPSVWGAMNWDIQPRGYIGVTMGVNSWEKD